LNRIIHQLVFDVVNEGTLFAVWGENVSGQVLACFKPNKPVPAFKYSASGKQELMRKFRGEKARFYEGCAQFFKLAKEYEGMVWLTSPSIGVYLRENGEGSMLKMVPGGECDPVSVSNFTAVAVLPPANTSIVDGVKMMQEQVLRVGLNEGWGLALS